MTSIGAGWAVYLTGFALVFLATWAALSIEFPQRSTGCARCDQRHRETEFAIDGLKAAGPGMVTFAVVLSCLMWPYGILHGIASYDSHRRHADR